jgi:oligoendopeptidase F
MKKSFGVALCLVCLSPLARSAPQQAYSIDQTRYFATPEVEKAELKQRVEEASAFPAVAPEDPKALYDYLHLADVLHAQFLRHVAYLHLRVSQDIDDQADGDTMEQAYDADGLVFANGGVALHTLGSAAFSKAASEYPALNRYAYLPVLAERALDHGLPADQQRILDALAGPANANFWTLYQKTVRSTPFAKIATKDGELDAIKDGAVLSLNPDRTIRQAAWQARWDGYVSRADIYATILLGVVRLNDRTAKLEHFSDAPSRTYLGRDLDRKRVTEALAAIESHAMLLKTYQRLRASHIAAFAGIADVHSWDLSLPPPGFTTPRMTLDQSRAAVLSALAPLGAGYVEHFRQLLDPANGRMDIAAVQGKRTNGGFSIGAPGVPSGLFIESYGPGLINNTRVIIHEGGHAIHRQLMAEADIPSFYTEGPNWMFEAFAILNEFLLYDHLYRARPDLKAQAYYLESLLADMTFTLFGSAEEATLEQSIYDGVAAGRVKDTADLDALTLSIWNNYEIWPASEPQFAHAWISDRLMVQDPLYQVNYLYAGLLATKMFDMVKHDPAAFRNRYLDLLRNGFYAAPEQLLRRFFGRELSQRELVDDSMNILQQRIQSLAELYKKLDTKR